MIECKYTNNLTCDILSYTNNKTSHVLFYDKICLHLPPDKKQVGLHVFYFLNHLCDSFKIFSFSHAFFVYCVYDNIYIFLFASLLMLNCFLFVCYVCNYILFAFAYYVKMLFVCIRIVVLFVSFAMLIQLLN